MSLYDLLKLLADNGGAGIVLLIIITSLIEITPIKINPISKLFKWIGSKMNEDMDKRIEVLEQKLDEHIEESAEERATANKERILSKREKFITFASKLSKGYVPTFEESAEFVRYCDEYESYCKKSGMPNGVADMSASLIRNKHYEFLSTNGFVKNEE